MSLLLYLRHPAKPVHPAPLGQPEEDRFGLVVGMMSQEEITDFMLMAIFVEETIPGRPCLFLNPGRRLLARPFEDFMRQPPFGNPFSDLPGFGGGFLAEAVIDGQRMKRNAAFLAPSR